MGNPSHEFEKLIQNKSKQELLDLQSKIRKQPGFTSSKMLFLVTIEKAINSFNK